MVRRKRWVVMAHALGLASLPGGCVLEPTIHPVETILLADVSTGFHSCALTLETAVFCWGSRAGDGTTLHRNTPTPVATPAGVTFHSVSAGGHFTCALSDAAATYCWGSNNVGQLGDGSTTDRVAPVPVQTPAGISFSSVSAGMEHACALAAGVAYCWGGNSLGRLGDGTMAARSTPASVAMPPGVLFASVAVAAFHSCGLSAAGVAYCWGDNGSGSLGDGTNTVQPAPVPVTMPAGVTFSSISAGGGHTCGLSASGAAYCWGLNTRGQLGDGTTTNRSEPTVVATPTGVTFVKVSVGSNHTCGLTAAGTAFCWGRNLAGEVGDGTPTSRSIPTPVALPAGVAFVNLNAGFQYACGVTLAGLAYCWGSNLGGKLGDGTTTDRLTPVRVQQQWPL